MPLPLQALALVAQGPLTTEAVARRLSIPRARARRICRTLEAWGHITINNSRCRITSQGRARLAA